MLLKCLPCSASVNGHKELENSPEFSELDNMSMNSSKQNDQATISAVRLQISINEVKCCRKLAVKGLYGDHVLLKNFISLFRKKIHDFVNTLPGASNPAAE